MDPISIAALALNAVQVVEGITPALRAASRLSMQENLLLAKDALSRALAECDRCTQMPPEERERLMSAYDDLYERVDRKEGESRKWPARINIFKIWSMCTMAQLCINHYYDARRASDLCKREQQTLRIRAALEGAVSNDELSHLSTEQLMFRVLSGGIEELRKAIKLLSQCLEESTKADELSKIRESISVLGQALKQGNPFQDPSASGDEPDMDTDDSPTPIAQPSTPVNSSHTFKVPSPPTTDNGLQESFTWDSSHTYYPLTRFTSAPS